MEDLKELKCLSDRLVRKMNRTEKLVKDENGDVLQKAELKPRPDNLVEMFYLITKR